ncbi:zinc finger protein 718-like isoform X2 [Wyeomyia smithii]|uniref:zinc finger protein 718-like isoform X2 n=1 Tax=Wyeomyia smithii TaxID=174621 RepID=UPI002468176A|nr:zinc finger protein 718-like isoform X2 [Wyeomyia smithii]
MSFINCCRLCLMELLTADAGCSYYCIPETTLEDRPLQYLIHDCFGISITEDEKVNKICESCYNDVQNVFRLKNRFLEADVAIRNFYCQLELTFEPEFFKSSAIFDEEITAYESLPDAKEHIKVNSNDLLVQMYTDDSPKNEIKSKNKTTRRVTRKKEPLPKEHIEVKPNDLPNEIYTDDSPKNEIKSKIGTSRKIIQKKEPPLKIILPRKRSKAKDKIRSFTCYICTTDFDTLEQLDDHIPKHVGQVSPVCTICNVEVTTMRHLNLHIQRTHHRKGKRIPCEPCKQNGITKEFSSSWHHKEHIKRIHEGIITVPEKKYVCSYCGKSFHKGSNMRLHENIHTKAVLFKCKFCTKFVGVTRSALIRHERVHTAEKPFKCNECDAQFVQSNQLTLHIKHRHKDERPFACYLCDGKVTFKNKYTLRKHIRSHETPGRIRQSKATCHMETLMLDTFIGETSN